jgi:PEP-CTERM motif
MKMRHILAVAALVIGMGTASVAKADTCSTQSVVTGFSCSLGDLTFTFEEVSGIPSGSFVDLALEAPTGVIGNLTSLVFQVAASSFPIDLHLIYEVTSTSASITALDSTFNPVVTNPPTSGQIAETACSSDPMLTEGSCPSANILGTGLNTTGGQTFTTPFDPQSTLWVDKDVEDNGFSSFSDSIEQTATPEPSSIALFGTGMLAAAGVIRRRLVK